MVVEEACSAGERSRQPRGPIRRRPCGRRPHRAGRTHHRPARRRWQRVGPECAHKPLLGADEVCVPGAVKTLAAACTARFELSLAPPATVASPGARAASLATGSARAPGSGSGARARRGARQCARLAAAGAPAGDATKSGHHGAWSWSTGPASALLSAVVTRLEDSEYSWKPKTSTLQL